MRAIIISGMPASGKTTLAKFLADQLKLKYYGGGDALKQIAAEKGLTVSGDDWWDTAKGLEFLNIREKNSDFDKEVDKKLISFANSGNVVISSYTLPWLFNGGMKFWLGASQKVRAERMANRDSIPFEESIRVTKIRDEKNESLYKALYGVAFGSDLSVFDFSISTDNLSREGLFDIATTIVRNSK